MKTNILKRTFGGMTLATLLAVAVAPQAGATTYSFTKLTNNGNPDVAGQLTVDVTAGLGGTVNFTFYNTASIASSITDIYFDDGTLLAIANITGSAGVSFSDPASPSNLPGGNLASPAFVTTQDFSADSSSPTLANGVNAASEWVTINFTLQGTQTFADTLAALASGALRIGLHVQGIGIPGGSDSYINSPTTGNSVPDGGTTIALLGAVLVGADALRRKLVKA